MRSGRSRREFLRVAATTLSGAIAGCAARSTGDDQVSVTPAPVPTTSTETADPTPERVAELSDRMEFEVEVLSEFSETLPARLEITVWNRNEKRVTALAGSQFVLPFVDRDFAGVDQSGDPGLSLVPDETRVIIDRPDGEPRRLTALLPDEPIDGCWQLPFAWSPTWLTRDATLQIVTMVPGEWRSHRYSLYFIEDCGPGTYSFENRFDLTVGEAGGDRDLYIARLGFDVTVREDRTLQVSSQDPEIAVPSSGQGRK